VVVLIGALVSAVAGNGLTIVVFGTVAFSLVMSLAFLLTRGSGSTYEQVGSGGFVRDDDPGPQASAGVASGAERAEQEREVRQMLVARSERRVRRGETPLDIDAEVARLLAPPSSGGDADPALVEEIRQMVLARNERRARQGQPQLDVEAEIARTLQELDP